MDESDSPDFPSRRERGGRRNRTGLESILTGVAVIVGFSIYWSVNVHNHNFWPIFPMLFFGLFPIVRGVRKIVTDRIEKPKALKMAAQERASENERAILRLARAESGRLTPSLVAVNSDMSIEEAEAALQDLTRKGHATMVVKDDGRIVYELSEFMPRAIEQ